MTLHEIARCLYKTGWADTVEYRKALAAFDALTLAEMDTVCAIGKRYK